MPPCLYTFTLSGPQLPSPPTYSFHWALFSSKVFPTASHILFLPPSSPHGIAHFQFEIYLLLLSFRVVWDIHHFLTYYPAWQRKDRASLCPRRGHLFQPQMTLWSSWEQAPTLLATSSLPVSSSVAGCPQCADRLNLWRNFQVIYKLFLLTEPRLWRKEIIDASSFLAGCVGRHDST